MLFLRTGRAAELTIAVESLGKALRKAWYLGGRQGNEPGIDNLAKALARFGNEIETVRTGSLLLGGPPKNPSAVVQLLDELQRSKEVLPRHIPPLADVLDRLRTTVEALRTDQRLSQPDGRGPSKLSPPSTWKWVAIQKQPPQFARRGSTSTLAPSPIVQVFQNSATSTVKQPKKRGTPPMKSWLAKLQKREMTFSTRDTGAARNRRKRSRRKSKN